MSPITFSATLFAIISACIATPFVIHIAHRFKLLDDKKLRYHPASVHEGIIPRGGGLALFIGILIPCLFFLPATREFISILLGSCLLVIVGLLDDRKDIHPYIRLITNTLAVCLVLLGGVRISYITNPFNGNIFVFSSLPISFFVSFLWIYWTMNIVGWSAGIDGQLPGVVAIAAFVLGILSLRFSITDPSQQAVTILSFIVAGSFLGFLPWNFYPQKIMPGYGGKTLAGFLLAVLGILSSAKVGTALLVLGIPMIDAIFTLIRRMRRGKSLVQADRGHLHHLLLNLGWSKRMIALCYYLVSAILGAVALSVNSRQKVFIFLLVALVISGFLLWVNWAWKYSKQHARDNG